MLEYEEMTPRELVHEFRKSTYAQQRLITNCLRGHSWLLTDALVREASWTRVRQQWEGSGLASKIKEADSQIAQYRSEIESQIPIER